MTKEEKWKAVSNNDAGFDGVFFYAVKSTGIFCRPSCRSKLPKKENILFFDSAQLARKAGFRPCKRCRSELPDYKPAKDAAAKTKQLADSLFREKSRLYAELKKTGLSRRRAEEIFRQQYGISLFEYVKRLRFDEIKRLLIETNNTIADTAYSAGFSSLGAFYRFFKTGAGIPPAAYKKKKRKISAQAKS